MTAPALANPDYSKCFHLYVSERKGYASAVLTQLQQGMGKQAITYYSTALDNVEKGMPPCYRSLAAAAFAYQKVSTITMGHPVTLYTTHALHALLTSQTPYGLLLYSIGPRTNYRTLYHSQPSGQTRNPS